MRWIWVIVPIVLFARDTVVYQADFNAYRLSFHNAYRLSFHEMGFGKTRNRLYAEYEISLC